MRNLRIVNQGEIPHSEIPPSPDLLNSPNSGTVFIASHIYQKEIKNILKTKYKFRGKVITV